MLPTNMGSFPWGVIVAALLLLGSTPLFLGLPVVLPVLGHATWHLYRKVVVADGYHRLCAVYSFDEDALIRCKICDG